MCRQGSVMFDDRCSQRRLNRMRLVVLILLALVLYALAGTDDCPGKDIAQLTDGQRSEVINRLND